MPTAVEYLKIDGIDGEATASGHENWIDVLGFSWGNGQPLVRPGITDVSSRASFHTFNVTKHVDKSTPTLMQSCASGQHFKTVVLDVAKTGDTPVTYFTIKMSNCFVSSAAVNSVNADPLPTEQVGFSYEEVQMTYTPFKPDGTQGEAVIGSWDLATNAVP